ncbi:MAG TPA: methyltransferase domain-containing protein [Dongiaceae bacterium]|jgi:SAM-dependent methyltransferase
MGVQSGEVAQKLSFKTRLRAWWEGDILSEPKATPAPAAAAQPAAKASRLPAVPVHPVDRADIRFPQHVWGDGFAGPGDAAFILKLVNPFAVNSESTLMDFGASLGGGARAISEKFGIWITGFEPDPDLAVAGHEISMRKGMKRAEVKPYSLQDFAPKAASFDGVFSHDTLHTLPGKEKLLGTFVNCLKPRGHIAITDFVVAPGISAGDERLAKFTGRAGQLSHFWSDQQYQAQLSALKFDIRIDEDITASYRSMIIEGWVNFTESGGSRSAAKEFPDEMVAEADFWTRRTAAIDSGIIQLRRYHAIKI